MTYYYHLLTFMSRDYALPITLLMIFLILAFVVWSLMRNGATVEYIEEGEDSEDGGPKTMPIPEDVKYRADWLTIFMNYIVRLLQMNFYHILFLILYYIVILAKRNTII